MVSIFVLLKSETLLSKRQLISLQVVKKKIKSRDQLEHLVRELMSQPKMLQEMYGLGVAESHIYEEMNNFIPHIHTWSQRYLGSGKVQGG